jgi:exosortase
MAEKSAIPLSSFEAFRQELAQCLRQLPRKGIFLVLLALWIALFQFFGNSTLGYINTGSLFRWLWVDYNAVGTEDSHGPFVPLVVLGLFWWKRKEWSTLPTQVWAPGLIGLSLAVVLHVIGYGIQQPRVSVVAFIMGIFALMGLVWGKGWLRVSFFPFILLVFCLPVGELAEGVSFPLRLISTKMSVVICRWVLGLDVIRDGVTILDAKGAYSYNVDVACSGIRGLITLLALTTIYGFSTFRKSWKRGLFVLLAAPLALAGNVARITTVVMTREAFGASPAHVVHEWFGFVTFASALVVVLVLGHWLSEDSNVSPVSPSRGATF